MSIFSRKKVMFSVAIYDKEFNVVRPLRLIEANEKKADHLCKLYEVKLSLSNGQSIMYDYA